jgi:hypothetical protein
MKLHYLAGALVLAPMAAVAQLGPVPGDASGAVMQSDTSPPSSAAPVVATPPVPVARMVVLPATPSAQPVSSSAGPILWRNIAMGMSVAQLRQLYPQGSNVTFKADRTVLSDVPVIEGCNAKVNVMHESGNVKEIVMRGEGSLAGRCSAKIIAALSGKYGEPLDKEKVRGTFLAREGKNYVWTHDGVTLLFKRYTNGAFGGGGLFAASWEMRYSATAGNIDL